MDVLQLQESSDATMAAKTRAAQLEGELKAAAARRDDEGAEVLRSKLQVGHTPRLHSPHRAFCLPACLSASPPAQRRNVVQSPQELYERVRQEQAAAAAAMGAADEARQQMTAAQQELATVNSTVRDVQTLQARARACVCVCVSVRTCHTHRLQRCLFCARASGTCEWLPWEGQQHT